MTRLTLANGTEVVSTATVEDIMSAIASAAPSPWITLETSTEQTAYINTYVIALTQEE